MTAKNPEVAYTELTANDPLAELVERANDFWKGHKQRVTATSITNACNAISGILQSFPK